MGDTTRDAELFKGFFPGGHKLIKNSLHQQPTNAVHPIAETGVPSLLRKRTDCDATAWQPAGLGYDQTHQNHSKSTALGKPATSKIWGHYTATWKRG